MALFRNKKAGNPPDRRRRSSIRSAPSAFNYHARRSERPEAQGRDPSVNELPVRNTTKKPKTLGVITLLLLLLALLVILGLGPSSNIIIVQPSGFNYQPRPLNQYAAVANGAINSSPLNHLKPTISSNSVEVALKKHFPEVSGALVTVPLIGFKPSVYVEIYAPKLIIKMAGSEVMLNQNGVITGQASLLPAKERNSLTLVDDATLPTLTPGTQVLTSTSVSFINTVNQALKAKNISVSSMNLLPSSEELDAYITGEPYYVKFDIHSTDPLQQVGTFLAAAANLKSQGVIPSKYIDVRVDDRAYYQ